MPIGEAGRAGRLRPTSLAMWKKYCAYAPTLFSYGDYYIHPIFTINLEKINISLIKIL